MNNLAYVTKKQTSSQVITFNLSCVVKVLIDREIRIGSWRFKNAVRIKPKATQPICRCVPSNTSSPIAFRRGDGGEQYG